MKTLQPGHPWALRPAVFALVLLSGGCTTIVVENPTVEIEIHVAGPVLPPYQPMDGMAVPYNENRQ